MNENRETWASLDKPFPCLICGKRLEAAAFSDELNADLVINHNYGVHDGLDFKTSGAYGSRILDGDGPLYFAICDVCLLQRRHRMLARKRNSSTVKICGECDSRKTEYEIQNGVEFYDEWLRYVKDESREHYSQQYWDSIKDGEQLAE